ncbi:MAG: transketolase family protein [Candidatus Aenigmatarchaeota archaeon]|nr:MAG: transketolase family protein [Candidatus Aenigmarchaeota archaeon]
MTNIKWLEEPQRPAFARALVALGHTHKDVVVAGADVTCSTMTNKFAEHFPERHYNFDIAEQNMISACAGMATTGKVVFASTFAIFGTGRVYDQIRQSVCYPKLNVKLVVTHAGITVGGDGATHQMIEDIALMRALPNMTVVVPADAPETEKAVLASADYEGPVYIRLGRANVPVCTIAEECQDFEIGKATTMRDGADVTLVGTGIMVAKCLEAAEELKKHNVDVRVINLSTIKPLDERTLIKAARETGGVVTAEEHSVVMGMGAAVALVLAENAHVPMKRVGIPDSFGESGSSNELMEKYGLTVDNIVDGAHDVLKRMR